jgi:hypothetical protein
LDAVPAGKVDAGSFEFYEGIRILIPGAVLVALYAAVVGTLDLSAPHPQADALGAVAGALLGGLLFYFVDAPPKSAVFTEDELPDAKLASLGITVPESVRSLNFYFVVLDEMMPPPIRARALYMGSMFRIGFEVLYMCVFAFIGIVSVGLTTEVGPAHPTQSAHRLFAIVAGLHVALFAGALYLAHARRRAWSTRFEALRRTAKDLRDQVPPVDRVLLGGSALSLVWYLTCGTHPTLAYIGAVGLGGSLWTIRYFRGYRQCRPASKWYHPVRRLRDYIQQQERGRRSLNPPAAMLYLVFATGSASLAAAIALPDKSIFSPNVAAGWLAVSLVAALLVISRGHEKRLGGSYATQRTWLEFNAQALRDRYEQR